MATGGNPQSLPDFDAKALSRQLLRRIRTGALATLDHQGLPFASLVTVATDHDGSPLLLLSRLAAHTQHLERDAHASILLAETGKGDPLAHPRLTVSGTLERSGDARVRSRFLKRHPKAKLYADFPDFSFWRMGVTGGHINGGFARAARLSAEDLTTGLAGAEALIEAEADALTHLDHDHEKTLAFHAARLAGQPTGPWVATGLDPEGIDLMAGERTVRLTFPERITDLHGLGQVFRSLGEELLLSSRGSAAEAPD